MRLPPRTPEHAGEVGALAEVDLVQPPQLAPGTDGDVGALLLLEQRLVDVLGSGQLLPATIKREEEEAVRLLGTGEVHHHAHLLPGTPHARVEHFVELVRVGGTRRTFPLFGYQARH